MNIIIALIFVLTTTSSQLYAGQNDQYWSICVNNEDFDFLIISADKSCQDPIAGATFRNEINETGWAYLEVQTFSKFEDEWQAYAAGIVEAKITKQLIQWHWKNTVAGYCKNQSKFCDKLDQYLQQNLQWIEKQLTENPTDPYWKQVSLMLIQLAGLEDGYYNTETKPHRKISSFGFILFQLSGDLEDLEQAFNRTPDGRVGLFRGESCSALIVPLAKNKDILFSHVTWSVYRTMLRIQKLYKFAYSLNGSAEQRVPSTTITLSSYPGTLHSVDDFYLLESGLAVTETTIGNSNASLWKNIVPENTILSWIRVMVANRLATVGKEWVDIFIKYNSGTYNNQFMVLDYKKFKPGRPLPKSGLFHVVEQAPGFTMSQDLTNVLTKQGYWPSYNVPYFPEIFNLTGNTDSVKEHGDWFTYDKTPRALIFKREWQKVVDLDSLTRLMRYNDYKNDPLSACNCTPPYSAENAISARNDLNPANGTYPFRQLGHRPHGGTDMKATSYEMFQKLKFYAISGPTYDNQPPFKWSTTDFGSTTPHEGHPDIFAFKPVMNKWKFF